MKNGLSGLLIFWIVFAGSQCQYVNASQKKGREVARDFSYPESPSIMRIETPMLSKSLSGTVCDPAGLPIPRVLVEDVGADWKKRIDATFTDSDGSFAFSRKTKGKHFLKLSMSEFDILLVTIIITKKPKTKLRLYLNPST